nr:outer membrane beta-barrel protein [uncultured Allomuricauda sp.]
MKKLFFAIVIVAGMTQFSNAQEQNKFRVGLDLGYAIPDGGGGILFALEPKYNIADNMNIGIRFESAALAKNITGDGLSVESNLSASASYMGTFDYYFNSGTSSPFAPFIGAGVGYSTLANLEVTFEGFTSDVEVDGKFGGLIRAGFEVGKFRVAANYNLIGKTEIEETETKNSYIGISLGFYVGGGKWRN